MKWDEIMNQAIAARAYEIYLSRQRPHLGGYGNQLSDWLKAEEEIKGHYTSNPITFSLSLSLNSDDAGVGDDLSTFIKQLSGHLPTEVKEIWWDAKRREHYREYVEVEMPEFQNLHWVSFDPSYLSESIALICAAAGGTKAVIEIIKAWVEDRKGRKIIIKGASLEQLRVF